MNIIRRHWRQALSVSLVLCAAIWFGAIIAQQWRDFVVAFASAQPAFLAAVLILGILANAPYGVLFWWQLSHIEKRPVTFALSSRLLFVGQVVRYLPGRFWHFVYQASVTDHLVPVTALARVNLEYMAIVSWTGVGVSLSILASGSNAIFGLCVLSGTLAGIVVGFRCVWHLRLLGLFAGLLPHGRVRNTIACIGKPPSRDWTSSLLALAVLSCVWGSYILGWIMLGSAWPALAELDLVRLCALYTLAWFIGFITMIAPAGIGVRELAFTWLAPGVPGETLVLLALVVRIWLTLVELLLFLMVLPVRVEPPVNSASQGVA